MVMLVECYAPIPNPNEDNNNLDIFLCFSLFFLFSGYTLLRDPHFNKGLAFTEKERDAHFLRGLLPPTLISQETQVRLTL